MNIAKKLREVREAKCLSQGDIERKSGLLRSYISRVESGYTAPAIATLEKFAKALGVEPYQLLYQGSGRPSAPKLPENMGVSKPERKLLKLFEGIPSSDRRLFLALANKFGKH